MVAQLFFYILLFVYFPLTAQAQLGNSEKNIDDLLSEAFRKPLIDDSIEDKDKTVEELIAEANFLFLDKRPIDARSKLLKVLDKDPNYYKAHALLGEYYLVHVGHYRLALKYIKRAQQLFLQQQGKPPYDSTENRTDHAYILYLLVQARLNLDNYEGALEILDEYSNYGYFASWYPGTRAWVLMKLGRIKEAIQTARIGVITGADEGRALNMLGILLSMDNDPQGALKVFRSAIAQELSLGEEGQPATPLNNSGEVYKELFDDEKAESTWRKAIRLPDGCEHVLPTLNLGILLMEQLRINDISRILDEFEDCVKQFPLRNGEEHKALVNLMRGRISLMSGKSDTALAFLEKSIEGTQWFGKIGTNENDLISASLISIIQAYEAQSNYLKTKVYSSFFERISSIKKRLSIWVKRKWLIRKAKLTLITKQNDIEDFKIRNTDSLIDYSSFGDLLEHLPPILIEKKIQQIIDSDTRKESLNFYNIYLAQSYLYHGKKTKAQEIVNSTLQNLRPRYDDSLKVQALLIKLSTTNGDLKTYNQTAQLIYNLSKATLRNKGFYLPVNYSIRDNSILNNLNDTNLKLDNSVELTYEIKEESNNGEIVLQFINKSTNKVLYSEKGTEQVDVLNKFLDLIF